MKNTNLTVCVRRLQSRKLALETELKLVDDELAECEEQLKEEQDRAAAAGEADCGSVGDAGGCGAAMR